MYGLRVAGPVAIGMSDMPAWRFILLNLVGAAIWAPLVTGVGYLFGETLQWLFADIKKYEEIVLASIIVLAVILGIVQLRRRRA